MAVEKVEMPNRRDLVKNRAFQEMVSTELEYSARLMTMCAELEQLLKKEPDALLKSILTQMHFFKNNTDRFVNNVNEATQIGVSAERRELLRSERIGIIMDFFEEYPRHFQLYNKFNEVIQKNPEKYGKLTTLFLTKHLLSLQGVLADPCQRGPRYSMLISNALVNKQNFDEENLQEFRLLKTLIDEELTRINEEQRELAIKEKQKETEIKEQQKAPEIKEQQKESEKKPYQFGDFFLKPAAKAIANVIQGLKESNDSQSQNSSGNSGR